MIGVVTVLRASGANADGGTTEAVTKERNAALPADDWRREKNQQFQEPLFSRNLRLVEVLRGISGKHGKSSGEVAIAWVLRQPAVTAAIVGARKMGQISQLVGASQWRLSPAEASEMWRFLADNPG
jgi:aryl-alcohol dehydrogenase-like predicted oxidoreductase